VRFTNESAVSLKKIGNVEKAKIFALSLKKIANVGFTNENANSLKEISICKSAMPETPMNRGL